jgi:predicted Zn-dependent protease with MMP-like domain
MSEPGGPEWAEAHAPSIDAFAALAEAALQRLPAPFRRLVGEVEMRILDFPEEEVLDALGIEDAFELTGLYQGVDLAQRSVFDAGPMRSMLFLYRRPILDEWCEHGEIALGELITHVLVHEIAHHFGLSDAQIAAIEAETEA